MKFNFFSCYQNTILTMLSTIFFSTGCYAEPSGKEVFKTPSIVLCQKQCETYPLFGYSASFKLFLYESLTPYFFIYIYFKTT